MAHASLADLEGGVNEIRRSPDDDGRVVLIARRPAVDARDTVTEAVLDVVEGVVGDGWRVRGSSRGGRLADPDRQVTLMNARAAALIAGTPDRWPLAGDQLYVDLDLSARNLPPGTRLAVGGAVLEISDAPHRGCAKFSRRFGPDALRFVNSPLGIELNLRGVNGRVVEGGTVHVGDRVSRSPASPQ
jgi:hypothetical protein